MAKILKTTKTKATILLKRPMFQGIGSSRDQAIQCETSRGRSSCREVDRWCFGCERKKDSFDIAIEELITKIGRNQKEEEQDKNNN
jgi:hypothetical protein